MNITLNEGRQEFKLWCNDDKLFDRFLENRQRLPAPENDMDYWVAKKNNKTPADLIKFLDNYKSDSQKRKEQATDAKSSANLRVIYEDDEWKVTQILTYKGARELGNGTVWCVTGRYPDHEEEGLHWFAKYYTDNNKRYRGYFMFERKHHHSGRCTKRGQDDPSGYNWDWKYMVCPLWSRPRLAADIYCQNDDEISIIPNCNVHIPGFPDITTGYKTDSAITNLSSDGTEIVRIKEFKSSANEVEELAANIVKIGPRAFLRSTSHWRTLRLPNVLEVGDLAFAGCSDFVQISLPACCKIGAKAFKAATDIVDIILGNVKEIPSEAFAYCNNIRIIIKVPPETDIEIADDAFINSRADVYISDPSEKVIEYARAHYKNIDLINSRTGEILNVVR